MLTGRSGTSTRTVTVQFAVKPPSSVATVMVAVPALTAVTVPFYTVATLVLLLVHVTFWFVALDGCTVAVSWTVSPSVRVNAL